MLIEGPQTPKIVPFPTPPQPYLPKDDLFVEVLKKVLINNRINVTKVKTAG